MSWTPMDAVWINGNYYMTGTTPSQVAAGMAFPIDPNTGQRYAIGTTSGAISSGTGQKVGINPSTVGALQPSVQAVMAEGKASGAPENYGGYQYDPRTGQTTVAQNPAQPINAWGMLSSQLGNQMTGPYVSDPTQQALLNSQFAPGMTYQQFELANSNYMNSLAPGSYDPYTQPLSQIYQQMGLQSSGAGASQKQIEQAYQQLYNQNSQYRSDIAQYRNKPTMSQPATGSVGYWQAAMGGQNNGIVSNQQAQQQAVQNAASSTGTGGSLPNNGRATQTIQQPKITKMQELQG